MNPTLQRASFRLLTLGLLIALLVPSAFAAADEGVTFLVNSTEDGTDISPGDGQCATQAGLCTLRAAVMEANAAPTAHRIELGSGVYYLSITGLFEEQATQGDLDIHGTLTLVGQGSTLTINDAGGAAEGVRGSSAVVNL